MHIQQLNKTLEADCVLWMYLPFETSRGDCSDCLVENDMILWSIKGQKQIINYMFNLSFNRNNINDSLNSEFFHFIQNTSHSYYASEFNNFEHINRIRNVHFDYNCFTSVIWLYSLYTFLAYDILYRLSFSVKILIWIRKQMINCYRTRKEIDR